MSRITYPSLRSTEADLCAWAADAVAGESFVYHYGSVAADRDPLASSLKREERAELDRVGRRALSLFDAGIVDLVQRREPSGDFTYIAIRRSGKSAAVSANNPK